MVQGKVPIKHQISIQETFAKEIAHGVVDTKQLVDNGHHFIVELLPSGHLNLFQG